MFGTLVAFLIVCCFAEFSDNDTSWIEGDECGVGSLLSESTSGCSYLSQFIQQKERVHCWSILNVFFDIVLWMTFGTGHQRQTLPIFNLVNVLRNTGDDFINHTGSFVGFLNESISVRLKNSSTQENLRSRGDISLLSPTTIPLFCQSSWQSVYVERVPFEPVEKSRRWSSQSYRQCYYWPSLDSYTQTDESREGKDEVITFLLLRG